MRLLHSLVLLSAGAAVPILGFALLAAAFAVQGESENLVNAAKARNRATLAAVDAQLMGAISTLHAMTSTPSLAKRNYEEFHRYARTVLANQPSWQNVVLSDRDGRQIVNARLQWGTPLLQRAVEQPSFDAAIMKREPTVADLTFAPRLANEPGIAVRVPITDDSQVMQVLTAVLSVTSFQQLLTTQGIPGDWVTGIVDKHGRLIARLPPTEPGKPASDDYLRHVRTSPEGWYRGKTLEGKDTFTAYSTSRLTGWSVGYAIPAESVLGGATRAAWLLASGIAVSLAAAAAIAIGLSRRIAKPLYELADAAAALPQRRELRTVASNIDEIHALSGAIAATGRTLAARDRELQSSSDELRKQAADLRAADENKSRFLALLAHELRNPLAPLPNGLEILKRTSIQNQQEKTRAMMERQIGHMTRLIDDLLDVSRIDRGLISLQRERLDFGLLVADVVESMRSLIDAKHQKLVVCHSARGLFVDGDAVRLTQAVSNILQNAFKFSFPHGSIEVTTKADRGQAVLTIKDSGIGFEPSNNERIFDLFVRLDGAHQQGSGGLGIGLSIVKSMIEMHGGSVRAKSEGPGTGATFELHLPLSDASEQLDATALSRLKQVSAVRCRVLIADDNVDAAESMAEILNLDGFDVRIAFDGLEALREARAFQPEVAFIDLHMPGMGGIELAAALKAEPGTAAIRLIALTGMGGPADFKATEAAGFEAHLTKPAAPQALQQMAAAVSNVGNRQG